MSNISDKLSEFPELLVLIDNPTEEDLLKVIYSDKVINNSHSALSYNIINSLPDDSITDTVATQAMCIIRNVYDSFTGPSVWKAWDDKFLSHVSSKNLLKVMKVNNFDISLFCKIKNPNKTLIDSYLNHITKVYIDNMSEGDRWISICSEINYFLTDNLKGRLTDSQQQILLDLVKQLTRNYRPDGVIWIEETLRPFITNNLIWLKYRLYSGLGDYKDGEEYQEG